MKTSVKMTKQGLICRSIKCGLCFAKRERNPQCPQPITGRFSWKPTAWRLLRPSCSPSWAVLAAACQELGQAVQGAVRIYLPLSSSQMGICCSLSSKFIWAEEKNNTIAHQITGCSETGVFIFWLNTILVFFLLEYGKPKWAVYKDWQWWLLLWLVTHIQV